MARGVKQFICDRLLPWAATGYVIAITGMVLWWNNLLDSPLPDDGTSGKWRGEYREFGNFCGVWGFFVYPLATYLILYFFKTLGSDSQLSRRVIGVVLILVACGAFVEFWHLGIQPFVGD